MSPLIAMSYWLRALTILSSYREEELFDYNKEALNYLVVVMPAKNSAFSSVYGPVPSWRCWY